MISVIGASHNKFRKLDPAIRQKFIVNAKHEGENIDSLNPVMCELTGLYYMWRHDSDEIQGLEHYRRYLSINSRSPITKDEIMARLDKHDAIVTKVHYPTRPVMSYFSMNLMEGWMNRYIAILDVMQGKAYGNHCRAYMNGHEHVLGNIFIARRELVDEYCRYLFGTLIPFIKFENQAGRNKPRVCGYLSEFLFGAWLSYNHKKLSTVNFCWN